MRLLSKPERQLLARLADNDVDTVDVLTNMTREALDMIEHATWDIHILARDLGSKRDKHEAARAAAGKADGDADAG